VCSDEDEDDKRALLYLPISPEIEDVEECHAADQQVTDYFCTFVRSVPVDSQIVLSFPGLLHGAMW